MQLQQTFCDWVNTFFLSCSVPLHELIFSNFILVTLQNPLPKSIFQEKNYVLNRRDTVQVWRVRRISAWCKSMTLWCTTKHRPEMEKPWKADYNTSLAGPRNFSLMQIDDLVEHDITSPRNGKHNENQITIQVWRVRGISAWCKSMTLWCTT